MHWMQVHEILRWVITPQILETISARRVILGVRGAQVALKCTPPRMAYKVQRSGRLSGFWLELVRHNFFVLREPLATIAIPEMT